MKTTLEISQPLFFQAKEIAAAHAMTFRALVEQGLQLVLAQMSAKPKPFVLKDGSFKGEGLQPEFENANWATIRAACYEGRGG